MKTLYMQTNYLKIFITVLISTLFFLNKANAQTKEGGFFSENIDYEIRAHFSIGGTSPLGLPKEIRKIESYNPTLQLGLSAQATKWFGEQSVWGLRMGVSVTGKGMKTEASVKNYLTEIIQDGSKVGGYYTGKVQTKVKNTYVVLPVSAVYKLSEKWKLYSGLHVSFLIDRNFDGYVSDGYLRQGSPVGLKISFEGDNTAAYDFSNAVNNIQWGMQIGGEWALKKHLNLFAEVEYDFNSLLDRDFKSISFTMHNIYLNIGFGYKF